MIENGGAKKASHGRETGPSFGDIVGQTELKRALLAVAANDDLDGLLVRGEKGTAKSTAVRALPGLLPEQTVVEGCPYGCPPGKPDAQCESCRDRSDPPTTERPVPLVTLPLGATRERVVGALSVADALDGDHGFEPGLLARANRGVLYVDEVNLLDDHLVDVLLDAAASGVNRVERDGVSVTHPAQFTLVGTMNPEEGDLRPQLRDRFALRTTVTACEDLGERVRIIDRALGRSSSEDRDGGGRRDHDEESASSVSGDGSGTAADDAPAVDDPESRLREARARLPEVALPADLAREIAELCRDAGVDGHRADIATARAARTLAALDGRTRVREPDVRRAAELAVPHRLESRPFEDAPDADEVIDEHFDDERDADPDEDRAEDDPSNRGDDARDETDSDGRDGDPGDTDGTASSGAAQSGGGTDGAEGDGGESRPSDPSPDDGSGEDGREPAADPGADAPEGGNQTDAGADGGPRGTGVEGEEGEDGGTADGEGDSDGSDAHREGTPIVPGGARAEVGTADAPDIDPPDAADGAGIGAGDTRLRTGPDPNGDGARVRTRRADATGDVDAAASVRAATARGATEVESRDLRQSVRQGDAAALVVFVVDASASMRPAMRAAKGTVLELLRDAYRARDEVAFVAFAGDGADVLLPPTDSVTLAARHLKDLPTGDRTPLPAGLETAGEVIDRADPAASVVVLVTDGKANVADGSPVGATRAAARRLAERDAEVLVVDAGDGDGLVDVLASETGGHRVPLSALSADGVDAVVGAASESQL